MEYLIRYGAIPEVARCRSAAGQPACARGAAVVIRSHRGLQLGTVVEAVRPAAVNGGDSHSAAEIDDSAPFTVVRPASVDDLHQQRELKSAADGEFGDWVDRIRQWNIDVQLVDLEWTLDHSKRVLYVLNERGPECTKLAIQAAAAGLGIIEVQPVSSEGLVSQPSGGGCGTCGCHN